MSQKIKQLELKHKILEENYREVVKKCKAIEGKNIELMGENENLKFEGKTKSKCDCKKKLQKVFEEEINTLQKSNQLL